MTKQQIYDCFSFLEGLVSEDTYRRIVETVVEIKSTAVMPAAPSDAVMIPLDLVRRAARVLACASTSLIADGDKTFLELNEFYNSALSQTMQSQAGG